MKLKEALEILNIDGYEKEIVHASPSGELYYLDGYFSLAEQLKDHKDKERVVSLFSQWFDKCIAVSKERGDSGIFIRNAVDWFLN